MLTVTPAGSALIYKTGLKPPFCCGAFNSTSQKCENFSKGSFKPFPLPDGAVIFNRETGSTNPKGCQIENSTIHISTTTTLSASASALSKIATTTETSHICPTVAPDEKSNSTEATKKCIPPRKVIATGVGVGAPLSLGLFIALACLLLERRRRQRYSPDSSIHRLHHNGILSGLEYTKIAANGQKSRELHSMGKSELDGSQRVEIASPRR